MKHQLKSMLISFRLFYSLIKKHRKKCDRQVELNTGIAQVALVALALLLFPLISPSKAITIRDDTPNKNYVKLATQYQNVGKVRGSSQLTRSNWLGSGVLIAPNWVLTAAHVVEGATSLKFVIGGQTLSAYKWFTNPSWDGDLLAGNDIALIQFTQDLSLLANPAKLYQDSPNTLIGQVGTFVGFGMTGNGLTGFTTLDGKKRATQNMIDSFASSYSQTVFLSDFDSPDSVEVQKLEGLIAPGDSGGGVFVNNYLAGINSFVIGYDGYPNSNYGDVSGHTLVSTHLNWINKIVYPQINASIKNDNLVSVKPTKLESVPEPLTILGTATALGFGVVFKRKLAHKNIRQQDP